MLGDLSELDEGQIGNLVMQAEGHLATAQARGFTAQQKSFTAWAMNAWAGKAGLLHRHAKEQQAPRFELCADRLEGVADPGILIDIRTEEWGRIWTDPVDTKEDIAYQLGRLRDQAWEHELEALTLEQLGGAISATSTAKARRVDHLGPHDLARAPIQARAWLLRSLHFCEKEITWPRQWAATKCALAAKPRGEDRALGTLALPVKLWSRARGG
eukprot:2655472-Pyramimonas_sp.AAC.1